MAKVSGRTIWLVMEREFLTRIFSRSFLASTFLIPAFLVAIVFIPAYLLPHPHSAHPPFPSDRIAAGIVSAAIAVAVLFYVLFVSLFSYGAIVMRSVLEEKQSRVLEILLCCTSADELMAGKILGVGGLALAQVLIWIGLGALGVAMSTTGRAVLAATHFGPGALVWFLLFEILGYLLYSAMFCAVGAAFNSIDEAQQWTFILVFPLVATGMLLSPVLSAPGSASAVIGSMVPFTAPALMYARVLIGSPPLWQIMLSVGLLIVSIAAAVRVCAQVYRVGILMHGKRPTAREIARWIRYA